MKTWQKKCQQNQNIIVRSYKCQLTPKCKKLHLSSIKLTKKLNPCSKQIKTYKSKARMAHKLSKDNSLNQLINKVDKITYSFIMSQIKNQSKKVQGQRFTLDDKILALSIYKQSPKAYTYLSTIFSLPCRKTIMGLLKNFLFFCLE